MDIDKFVQDWRKQNNTEDAVYSSYHYDAMEAYAREKVKEFILFYNNRQSKVNTIALKDEMELFYDEN